MDREKGLLPVKQRSLNWLYRQLAAKNFFIKPDYMPRLCPDYYLDTPLNLTYQPDVYSLAYYLAEHSGAKYVIDIGSGNGLKLKPFLGKFKIICIDFGGNQELLKENLPGIQFLEANLEKSLPEIDEEIIKNAIVIMSDVIEHIIDPHSALQGLSHWAQYCPYLLLSTPDRIRCRGTEDNGPPANVCHVREWTLDEFYRLLRHYQFGPTMYGYTVNTDYQLDKSTMLVIGGTYIYRPVSKMVKVLAVINVFNESDILYHTIRYLLDQDVDVYIVDNWSTDDSAQILDEFQQQYPERVTIERFPEQPAPYYEWEQLLKHTEKIAAASSYDWILHYDADELRESPWPNANLRQALSFIDTLGFNAVDFTVLDFRPTRQDEDLLSNSSVYEQLLHCEFGDQPWAFEQIKGWKNSPNNIVDLASSGGHLAEFPNRKVYPLKFLMRHYSLRSQKQAHTKIFRDRRPRFSQKEHGEKGWHVQYDTYKPTDEFLWKRNSLLTWNPVQFYLEYFVERLSGIGITDDRD